MGIPERLVPSKTNACLALLKRCVRGPDEAAPANRVSATPGTEQRPRSVLRLTLFFRSSSSPFFPHHDSRGTLPSPGDSIPIRPVSKGLRAWWINDWWKHLNRPPPTPPLVG